MHRLLLLDVVGLTPELIGPHTPNLKRLVRRGGMRPVVPVLPAVTCSVQTSFLTGELPRTHGIVGNGWYQRDVAEVALWKQSNHLVSGERLWDAARRHDPSFTCAKLFWWLNMYSSADWSVTPRPIYLADGQKIPAFYTQPAELHGELRARLGEFPLFRFWGPAAGLASTRWITDCALHVYSTRRPTLTLAYLPHLDYVLQREGPAGPHVPEALRQIDAVCGELVEHAERDGARWMIVSEYGITSVRRPVSINRALRAAGLLRVREELGREKLDPGASDAFAVADHQVAHVYVRRAELVPRVRALLEAVPGIDRVLDEEGKRAVGLDHPRSGELVALSERDAWLTYYYWMDDERAPEFARTVDIHRKPGYDPVELFLDPRIRLPRLKIGLTLLKKHLGMRTLLDVVPLDPTLVRGSHGLSPERPEQGPIVISSEAELLGAGAIEATELKSLVLAHCFDELRSRARDAA